MILRTMEHEFGLHVYQPTGQCLLSLCGSSYNQHTVLHFNHRLAPSKLLSIEITPKAGLQCNKTPVS